MAYFFVHGLKPLTTIGQHNACISDGRMFPLAKSTGQCNDGSKNMIGPVMAVIGSSDFGLP